MAITDVERKRILREWFDGQFRACLTNEDWCRENIAGLIAAGIDAGDSPLEVVRKTTTWAVASAIGIDVDELKFLTRSRN